MKAGRVYELTVRVDTTRIRVHYTIRYQLSTALAQTFCLVYYMCTRVLPRLLYEHTTRENEHFYTQMEAAPEMLFSSVDLVVEHLAMCTNNVH